MNKIKTASDLKYAVESRGMGSPGSHFFSRTNMRFAGDTMRNYGVRGPLKFRTICGESCEVWELYRRRANRQGLTKSAYFRTDTFNQTFGEVK